MLNNISSVALYIFVICCVTVILTSVGEMVITIYDRIIQRHAEEYAEYMHNVSFDEEFPQRINRIKRELASEGIIDMPIEETNGDTGVEYITNEYEKELYKRG